MFAHLLKSTAEKQRNWYAPPSNKSSQYNWQLFNIYKPRRNNVVDVIEYALRAASKLIWFGSDLSYLWNGFNQIDATLWQIWFCIHRSLSDFCGSSNDLRKFHGNIGMKKCHRSLNSINIFIAVLNYQYYWEAFC